MGRPNAAVLTAFLGMVVIGGVNFLAVRFSNDLMAPFWGAALRFGLAGAIFLLAALAAGIALPRGRALAGAVLYGLLSFGGAYAFAYWALTGIGPGVASVLVSLVPVLTLLLAVAQGLESFRWRALAGAGLAVVGVAVIFADRLGGGQSPLHLLSMLGMAVCAAQAGVVVKRFPRAHPVAMNAVGMLSGVAVLMAASLAAGEAVTFPQTGGGWALVAYLVAGGSIGLFGLYLFVISRWTASATSYAFVLTPVVAIPLGATLAGETIGAGFLAGSALIVAGTWAGALAGTAVAPPPPAQAEAAVAPKPARR